MDQPALGFGDLAALVGVKRSGSASAEASSDGPGSGLADDLLGFGLGRVDDPPSSSQPGNPLGPGFLDLNDQDPVPAGSR
jgi:hypothetical protein